MFGRVISAVIILVGIIVGAYLVVDYNKQTDPTLKSLLSKVNSQGVITDYANEIGVHSAEDITFSQDEKLITVNFGKFIFNIEKKDLTKPMLGNLQKLNLEVYTKANGNMSIKYKGKDLKEIVR